MSARRIETPWLSCEEAADYLRMSPKAFRNRYAMWGIPSYRLAGGRRLLFHRVDLDRALGAGLTRGAEVRDQGVSA